MSAKHLFTIKAFSSLLVNVCGKTAKVKRQDSKSKTARQQHHFILHNDFLGVLMKNLLLMMFPDRPHYAAVANILYSNFYLHNKVCTTPR